MLCLDHTFKTPQENLACDEVLLDLCEEGLDQSFLRFWEPKEYFVVLGYSNNLAKEVNESVCKADSIPVLRRSSGGGTVLQGPGCLNYSLILKINQIPELRSITETNCYILKRQKRALGDLVKNQIQLQGSSDLTLGALKFSGNAQRRKRSHVLFHGTFLLNMDMGRIEKYLRFPSKQPDYRKSRGHSEFLVNLKIPSQMIKKALSKHWEISGVFNQVPLERVQSLTRERYSTAEWNFRL